MSSHTTTKSRPIIVARPHRGSPVLVCRKCLKRCAHGREIKRGLKSELKRRSNGSEKPSRVVLTGCFGVCPKNAVTIANGATLRNGQYILISAGESADEAIALLTRS